MDLNITFIALVILLLVGIYAGYNMGFAKSLAGFISFIVTALMLGLFLRIYHTFTHGQALSLVITVIVLIVLGAVYGILRVFLKSLKAISKLPVIFAIDKLLGIVMGVIVIVTLFEVVAIAANLNFLGAYSSHIVNDIETNTLLTLLIKYNYLIRI